MDRNNKATLPRTAPSTVFKSSAKDLNLLKFEINIPKWLPIQKYYSLLLHKINPIQRIYDAWKP